MIYLQDVAQNAVIIAAIAVPAVIVVLLRVNAAVAFFSLCAGSLLVRYVGHEANLAGSFFSNSTALDPYSKLFLLLLPLVLTIVIMRKTIPAHKLAFNIVPAVAIGLVGVLLAVPLLSGAAYDALTKTEGWHLLEASQEFVVIASVGVSLIALWLTKPLGHGNRKKH